MRRSVRSRLLMAFTAGTVLVLVLGLSVLYVALARQLSGALDADLAGRGGDLTVDVRTGDFTAVSRDPMAQVFAADGTVVAGSAELDGRRLLNGDEVRAVHDIVLVSRDLPLGYHGKPLRVRLWSQPVGTSGMVLTVGIAATSVDRASDRQFEALLLAAPFLVAALVVLGWFLIRAALRPVDALTRQAAAISQLDSIQRLPVVHGDDEIARLAATLDSMLARLAVAFTRERAFVDDASHELRTPVTVLRGEIDLALAALDDRGEVEQSLLAARSQVDRLTRLAEDLLLLARERAGSLVVQREPVDLTDLTAAEAATLGPVTDLRIEVHGEPVVVEADPDRLRQVLTNLAANSAAAGAATARVQIAAGRDTASVTWADDGPGFPPDLVDSAFERFVRGDAARTTSGAGLGLSIVRAIVTAHGGTVELRNDASTGGAVVTIELPPA